MKKFLLLFGSTLLLSAVGSASIACPTATYDVYTTSVNAAGGCTISTTLFNNFTFTGISADSPVQLTAANVSVLLQTQDLRSRCLSPQVSTKLTMLR